MDKCERCKREVTEAVANFSKKKYDKTYCYDCQQVINTVTPQRERNPHTITLNGKQYVTHAGLLDAAHKIGLESITTTRVSGPGEARIVFMATVILKGDRKFSAYGDASKDSVTERIVPHILRMSETRAVNRALRFATNIGMTSIEELGEK